MVYKKADLNPKLYGITLTQELLGTISFYFPVLQALEPKLLNLSMIDSEMLLSVSTTIDMLSLFLFFCLSHISFF